MKKMIFSLLLLTGFSMAAPRLVQAGPTVYVNLGPYGSVGYPAGYVYPVNNGCCNGCGYNYPTGAYYNPYYNNPYSYNKQSINNPYVFDTTNINNVGRIAPVRMNPRNPYGY